MPRILFVSGFDRHCRARDLAYEFERFGPLVRCDVPAPRSYASTSPYAFVEFRSNRDADDAYHDMHGKSLNGYRLSVQWAKNPPSAAWRFDGKRSPPRRSSRRDRRSRSRSRSPRRRDDDRDEPRKDRDRDDKDKDRDRERERDDDRRRDRDRDRERERERDRDEDDDKRRRRSRSRERRRRSRSRSRSRGRDEREKRDIDDRDRDAGPSDDRNGDIKDDKAVSPPRS